MGQKLLTTAILVIGTVILVASLFADSLGIGNYQGFGFDQAVGSIVGAVITAIGLLVVGLYFRVNGS